MSTPTALPTFSLIVLGLAYIAHRAICSTIFSETHTFTDEGLLIDVSFILVSLVDKQPHVDRFSSVMGGSLKAKGTLSDQEWWK